MNSKEIQGVTKAWQEVMEKKTLDPVNKKALDKDFDDREDKDIDNDGDTDSSDKYLHNRRKTIKKAMKKGEVELDELSNDTLGSYAKKNVKSALKGTMPSNKSAQRTTGINRALDKTKKNDQHKESVELDELSKKTLGSYIQKAVDTGSKRSVANLASKGAHKLATSDGDDDGEKEDRKAFKRSKGIATAAKRLTKEKFDCAKQVSSEQWGFGECIPGQYSLVEYTDGSVEVTHYDIMFEHGVEFDVPVEELTVLMSETYEYVTESEELDEISSKLARNARDKAKASELDHKMKAYNKISKTKNIPFISKLGKKAAEPDIKMADRRKRQANLANRKLGGMGDYEYDSKGKYSRQGPAKVLSKEEVELDEAVRVNKQKYSWGQLITVHDGKDNSFPLHPDHQKKIKSLNDGQKITFKDETGALVTAHRKGDQIYLSNKMSSRKVPVDYSVFTESTTLGESTSVSEFEEVVVDAYKQRSRGMRGALEQMWEAAAQAKHGVDGKYQETMKSKFKGKGANDMAKDVNMDNPEVAADAKQGHADASKAGRVVKGQSPTRGGEKRMGDIKILRPVQGAVTKTTGKE